MTEYFFLQDTETNDLLREDGKPLLIKRATPSNTKLSLRKKPIHFANLISNKGDVSPICALQPRKLNLRRETWTMRKEAVTCPKCIAHLKKFPDI